MLAKHDMTLSQKLTSVGAGEKKIGRETRQRETKFFRPSDFFRRRKNLWNDTARRRDQNRPKIVQIGAILVIFRTFEFFFGGLPAPDIEGEFWDSLI